MRARSWLAVSCGTLTGSALAITGSPQSTATQAATTAHRRTIWIFTKILASWLLVGRDGYMVHFAQTSNNVTITTGSPGTCDAAQMSGSHLSSGDLLPV